MTTTDQSDGQKISSIVAKNYCIKRGGVDDFQWYNSSHFYVCKDQTQLIETIEYELDKDTFGQFIGAKSTQDGSSSFNLSTYTALALNALYFDI